MHNENPETLNQPQPTAEDDPLFSLTRFADSQSRLVTPVPTGGWIVVLEPDLEGGRDLVHTVCTGFDSEARVVAFSPQSGAGDVDEDNDAVVFEQLGIAIINHRDHVSSASIAQALMEQPGVTDHYPEFYAFPDAIPRYCDTVTDTWGRQAIGIPGTNYSGHGIRVAVLDTGIDVDHPDLAGKIVASKSFVSGQSIDDVHGHGTHCAGTIAGTRSVVNVPEYCVAPDVELVISKVLSDSGRGTDGAILAGMLWAVDVAEADVISMSLGSSVSPGHSHDVAYERAAAHALDNDCLVVAAAGNNSRREYSYVAPVNRPANSPSVLATAAVDEVLSVADFSNGGINTGLRSRSPRRGLTFDRVGQRRGYTRQTPGRAWLVRMWRG